MIDPAGSAPSRRSRLLVAVVVTAGLLAATAGPVRAQLDRLDQFLRGVPQVPGAGRLGDARIVEGLKEALQIGTGNAVNLTGRLDGYLANKAIKILLPDQVQRLEPVLRAAGLGPQLDELVVGMNRAAEQAAPGARSIFVDAIAAMSFDDARRVLSGGDTAATDYFRVHTSDRLTAAFRPVVERSMQDVGLARTWKDLTAQVRRVPFARLDGLDLDAYVVDGALGGLFHMVGEEERKIRRDPGARVTEVLRDVFGSARPR